MNRIKELRNEKGLTQQQLADSLKSIYTVSRIARYEKEDKGILAGDYRDIAQFFDVSVEYLRCATDERAAYTDPREKEFAPIFEQLDKVKTMLHITDTQLGEILDVDIKEIMQNKYADAIKLAMINYCLTSIERLLNGSCRDEVALFISKNNSKEGIAMHKGIELICADCSGVRNHIFSLNSSSYDENDCHDSCVIWDRITLYGIPFDCEDESMERIYSGNYSEAIKIGEIDGCLILCKKLLSLGEAPWEVCDDLNGDLEYTISALRDFDGPLNSETGDDYQDVYYIDQIKLEPEYNQNSLKSRIIEELPSIIFRLFHTDPDILAFFPAPQKYEIPPEEKERRELLGQIASAKLNDAFSEAVGVVKDENDTITKFANAYQLSEDEVNLIMRRRHSGSSYPEKAKDMQEFDFYLANDFKEVGDSRLLYKVVNQDL